MANIPMIMQPAWKTSDHMTAFMPPCINIGITVLRIKLGSKHVTTIKLTHNSQMVLLPIWPYQRSHSKATRYGNDFVPLA